MNQDLIPERQIDTLPQAANLSVAEYSESITKKTESSADAAHRRAMELSKQNAKIRSDSVKNYTMIGILGITVLFCMYIILLGKDAESKNKAWSLLTAILGGAIGYYLGSQKSEKAEN